MLGDLSRVLNRMSGGAPGQTLCARVGLRFGPYCWFCRLVGWTVRDPRHCEYEINGYPEN